MEGAYQVTPPGAVCRRPKKWSRLPPEAKRLETGSGLSSRHRHEAEERGCGWVPLGVLVRSASLLVSPLGLSRPGDGQPSSFSLGPSGVPLVSSLVGPSVVHSSCWSAPAPPPRLGAQD
uniref:Uncharacterized protein n=1 Tax=Knipowitschia caucasica TaxID=637954 RepID=A0AAV2KDH2_KNICA